MLAQFVVQPHVISVLSKFLIFSICSLMLNYYFGNWSILVSNAVPSNMGKKTYFWVNVYSLACACILQDQALL